MKKKLYIKILSVVGVGILIGASIIMCIQVYVKSTLDLKWVYVASKDLSPRTQITEEDILKVQIPNAYIEEDTYIEKEDIIGKYTDIQGTIPVGSPFYFSMLHEEKNLPDAPTLQLKQGQAVYTLQCSGMSISFTSGERVDLFLQIDQRNDTNSISGVLLENIRILAIQDHKGVDISDDNSSQSASWILLAVNEEDLEMLTYAETLGSLKLFSTSKSYDVSLECQRNEESVALSYVQHCLDQAKIQIQSALGQE